MKHCITIHDLSDIDRAAWEFLKEIGNHKIVAFFAPMGAGKTTFTTAICKALGVREDAVSSPTFAIINEYKTGTGDSMYHFDFYRITRIAEALDVGFYDYIDSGRLCIIEWPENIEEILPDETLRISITVNPDDSRTVSWED
ncbi:MAG: tRNA (adenosine(37)-N6)-threonylcarbamoyltransferase complex ATPase subunit type 1 TsaE [Bacteroidales bacterium]|nr:tRNA (adenosine(37)-N6)-threonylcarbamoyltransferase complex ATPase subunit type 1 TsaE [Bacteroidales bacterium]MDY6002385.1 tRNA (adenosine(37)-N6)-threonylcarbamoyltransferase complex ATPase subunit type 1 TsaE [Candidatus Cryptobacteroides sp.]